MFSALQGRNIVDQFPLNPVMLSKDMPNLALDKLLSISPVLSGSRYEADPYSFVVLLNNLELSDVAPPQKRLDDSQEIITEKNGLKRQSLEVWFLQRTPLKL